MDVFVYDYCFSQVLENSATIRLNIRLFERRDSYMRYYGKKVHNNTDQSALSME